MKSRGARLLLIAAVIGLIGYADYVSGEQLELFVLYPIPIVIAAWYLGPRTSIVFAVASAGTWFLVNHVGSRPYSNVFFGVWAGVVILLTFIAAAVAVYRIRVLVDEQTRLNRELTAAMAKIKRLSGRLPICLGCKRIQNENGEWVDLEAYFTTHSEDDFIFQQRVCPLCKQHVGDVGVEAY